MPQESALDQAKFSQLEALLNRSQMYTQFLTEQVGRPRTLPSPPLPRPFDDLPPDPHPPAALARLPGDYCRRLALRAAQRRRRRRALLRVHMPGMNAVTWRPLAPPQISTVEEKHQEAAEAAAEQKAGRKRGRGGGAAAAKKAKPDMAALTQVGARRSMLKGPMDWRVRTHTWWQGGHVQEAGWALPTRWAELAANWLRTRAASNACPLHAQYAQPAARRRRCARASMARFVTTN